MSNADQQPGRRLETVSLPSASPGTQRSLDIVHYGKAEQRPKAYLQAALHADEIPSLLVIHKLMHLLDEADQAGQIAGNIVLVPIANPIGLSQHLFGELAGRYDQASGVNFNRNYPALADEIAKRVKYQLKDDVNANTLLIRQTAKLIIEEQEPLEETAALKQCLMRNAVDADITLDLHCDWQSIMHLYTGTALWPKIKDLAAYLDAKVVLLEDVSGGNPFDEALSGHWWALAKQFPDKPIDNACVATTIELRGKVDTQEQQAEEDALGIFYYLQSLGVIEGKPPVPPNLEIEATPLAGVGKVIAPIAGAVSYKKLPGEQVNSGELVCVLHDITEYNATKSRIELKAPIDGLLYSCRLDRLARPGQVLARIAGKEVLNQLNKPLLED